MSLLKKLLVIGLVVASGSLQAIPPVQYGIVVVAEHRFDPAVQRYMAERELKALPIRGGALFYIVPAYNDPRIEEMQIRYIEQLLDKQRRVEPRTR